MSVCMLGNSNSFMQYHILYYCLFLYSPDNTNGTVFTVKIFVEHEIEILNRPDETSRIMLQ